MNRGVQWWSRESLQLHGLLLAGLTLCGVASWIEWTRALAGHQLAWLYAFEWPLFAVLGMWVWWRLLHGDRAPRAPRREKHIAADDPGLAAWEDYLARLHTQDPPGGPPTA